MRVRRLADAAARAALTASALLAWAGGCTSLDNLSKLQKAIGPSCLLDSDCAGDAVCMLGRCREECATSEDCEFDLRCVAGDDGRRACLLADEVSCDSPAECPHPTVCGVDGECRNACSLDTDCVDGQVCSYGSCAEPAELADTGELPVPNNFTGEGQPCQYSSECPGDFFCISQYCGPECKGDKDCAPGETCAGSRCVGPSKSCANQTDCDPGELCDAGACVSGCVTADTCAAGDRCVAGACESPLFLASTPPDALAAGGDVVLFSYANTVFRCPLQGCGGGGLDVVSSVPSAGKYWPTVLAVGPTAFAWSDGVKYPPVAPGALTYEVRVFVCPLSGCPNPVPYVPIAAPNGRESYVVAMALDTEPLTGELRLFFVQRTSALEDVLAGCTLSGTGANGLYGCTPAYSLTMPATVPPQGLAFQRGDPALPDDGTVFVAAADAVRSLDWAACSSGLPSCALQPVTSLVDPNGEPEPVKGIAHDDTHLYVVRPVTGDVATCPTGGSCSLTPLVPLQSGGNYGTAAASGQVLFLDGGIWSVPAPP